MEIKDKKQPLLYTKVIIKDSEHRLMKRDTYLIPELMIITGMTDEERADHKLMRDMADHTIIDPQKRIDDVKSAIGKIGPKIKFLDIVDNPVKVKAYQIQQPRIEIGGKKLAKISGKGKFDITGDLYDSFELANFAVVYVD
jgi:hypothetical protein